MLKHPAPQLSDADYHAMEAAISETARGRAFLAKHARRARAADTRLLISALERIEAGATPAGGSPTEQVQTTQSEHTSAPDSWAEVKAMSEEEKLAMFS